MRQARHLPQRWYWSIVLQVRDVIRQFTQGTPNCNTNPNATVFGIPKEPVLESAELITSRLTGAGSLLPPVYGEAWAKGHATGTPDSTFPGTGRRTRQTCGSDSKTSLNITEIKNSVSSGTPKRGTTNRLTGADSLLPPVYSEAWAKENAEVSLVINLLHMGEVWAKGTQRIP
ncbi:hypothetical protein TNCV_4817181 [Trichonephila clavipes]|nr:hypothetical protein TNCV_4817181 [Trichonephila clavipes]